MSMEEAIKDHAAALRELSAAIKEMYAGSAAALALPVEDSKKQTETAGVFGGEDAPAPDYAAKAKKRAASFREEPELDNTVEEVKAEKGDPIKQDADLEQAVAKVEDDALAAPLEYTKDVRPVLLQLSKAKGKDELLALLKKYGAKNGEAIKPEDFAKIVADANALIGG